MRQRWLRSPGRRGVERWTVLAREPVYRRVKSDPLVGVGAISQ